MRSDETVRRRGEERAQQVPLVRRAVAWAWACGLVACGGDPPARSSGAALTRVAESQVETAAPAACLARAEAPTLLPNVSADQRTLDYWLARSERWGDLDAPLMSRAEIAAHNRAMLPAGHVREGVALAERTPGRSNLLTTPDPERLRAQLERRVAFLGGRFRRGKYLNADGSPLPPAEVEAMLRLPHINALEPELRVALADVPIRCSPRVTGYYTESLDLAFDRNLCTTARAQELVQVLARWSDTLLLARTSYALGWISADAPLSPRISPDDARAFLWGPHQRVGREISLQTRAGAFVVSRGTRLPISKDVAADTRSAAPASRGERAPAPSVRVATPEGIVSALASDPGALASTTRPLTRRAALREAFSYLESPCGWGGYKGGRDCSRFLLDVFAAFSIRLPRNSAEQAVAGAIVIEVPEQASEAARLKMLDDAIARGLVLAHFPGHIMFYLGRDHRGVPMALHSFAEYVVPCPGRSDDMLAGERETLTVVGEVTISDLELGRGSSRGAFIERIDRLAVFGR